jgi:ribosomal protein S12 methylthiotransferase
VFLREVPGSVQAGDIVQVEIEDADAHDLFGVISDG